jgi:hypothetical protein
VAELVDARDLKYDLAYSVTFATWNHTATLPLQTALKLGETATDLPPIRSSVSQVTHGDGRGLLQFPLQSPCLPLSDASKAILSQRRAVLASGQAARATI